MYNIKYVIDDIFELPGYIIYLCDFSFLLFMLYWKLYKEALSKIYWIPKVSRRSWQCIKELYTSDCLRSWSEQ